jgi:hypothetical protein
VSVRELARGEARRQGEGLTADKMKECRWLKPVLAGQVEFVEWTPEGHLRHSKFAVARGGSAGARAVRLES